MEIREVPMPSPKADQVVVKLDVVGICGSDVHYFQHGRIGDYIVEGDFILGHECAGSVTAVGEQVKTHKIGDRVALEPGATCGHCEYCTSGNYNLCPEVEFLATPPYHGCFENYIAFPAHLAFHLPDNVTTRDGALVEPLSVGLEACSVGQVKLGSTVAILGAGCIGLTALLAAKANGASQVFVVDVLENRLKKALELGADAVFNAKEVDATAAILEKTASRGVDVVMETAGSETTTRQTVALVARGGRIVLVGMAPTATFPFPFSDLMGKVASIHPIFRYKNQYPVALAALSSGKIDVSGIVTHEYSFDKIQEAFDMNMYHKDDVVKTVIRFE
jgi:L-iditol 2-dehydrogenase